MSDATATIMGNATDDAELRFTQTGKRVANVRIARNHPPRPDGSRPAPDFYDVTAWEDMAENLAKSVRKGDRIIVTGPMTLRTYKTRDGETAHVTEISAREVGLSIKWNPVTSQRTPNKDDGELTAQTFPRAKTLRSRSMNAGGGANAPPPIPP